MAVLMVAPSLRRTLHDDTSLRGRVKRITKREAGFAADHLYGLFEQAERDWLAFLN